MQDWKRLIEALNNSDSISVFTHINSDGDCMGSAFALAYFYAGRGKNVCIFNEEKPPENLSFIYDLKMPENMKFIIYGTDEYQKITHEIIPDINLAVDVSEVKRLGDRNTFFQKSEIKARLDHHISEHTFAEITVCNANWAATAEGVWELLQQYDDFEESPYIIEIAKCLHLGILTDTGCFAYSNVTAKTHFIAARLIELAGNMAWQYSAIYENQTESEIKLKSIAYGKVEYFKNGEIAFLHITDEDLLKSGACDDDLSGLAPFLRTIKGVKVGILVKPGRKQNELKLSLRSDENCDVNLVASAFGGGGHKRAAGIVYSNECGISFEDYKYQLIGEVERWME